MTSEEFFRGILAGGEEIDRQFALTTPTIRQAFTVLRTGLVRSSEALNEVSAPIAGFIRDVGLAVTVLAGVGRQQIVTEQQTERIEAITTAFRVLRVAVISVAVVLTARFVRSLALSATASIVAQREALRLQLTLARMDGIARNTAAGMLLATRATTALRASMSLLGGPVGIALLAAYAIYEFASSVEEARGELGAGLGPLEDFRKSLEELTTAQRAVQRLDIEIDIDEAQGEIDRLRGGLEDIQRNLREGVEVSLSGLAQRDLPIEAIQELNNEFLRGQADIDLYTQRIQDLQDRLFAISFQGPVRPDLVPEDEDEDDPSLDEKARERSLNSLAKLTEAADNRIAASALSRIDQITRREEIGVAQAIELGRTRGVSAAQVEETITRIRVAGAIERQEVIEDEAERERQAEENRIERVQRLNDQAVRSITQSLISLQSEYDQAVIAAIQKAAQTAAALDRESAAYEANLETVRRVLDEETRLAGVVEQERIDATERRAQTRKSSLEHLRASGKGT